MRTEITHLKLSNFRNIPELDIDFHSGYNEIAGENGVGKTTILTAITYALFGKDIFNKKQFSIQPIIDGVEQKDMLSSVELTIDNSFVVSRTWDGKTTEVKTGFIEESGRVNLVKCTQIEFKRFLEEHFVNEEEFKSLSNINYLPSLNWKDLKEFIFRLIGEIKDEDVLLNGSFPLIEEFVKKMGVESLSKSLAETKKILNDDLRRKETETNYAVQMKLKYVNDGKQNEEMLKRKEELENKIAEWHKLKEIESQKAQNIADIKFHLNNLLSKREVCEAKINGNKGLIANNQALYKNCAFDIEEARRNDIERLKDARFKATLSANELESSIESTRKTLDKIIKEGNEEKQRIPKVEKSKCPTCGQELSEEKQQEALEQAKKEQLEKLTNLKSELDKKKIYLAELEEKHKEYLDEVSKIDKEIEEVENKEYEEVEETEKQKEIKQQIENLIAENETFEKEIASLAIEFEETKRKLDEAPVPKALESIYVSQAELKEINEKLSTTVTLQALEQEVLEKQAELDKLKEQKESLFEKEQEVVRFNDLKAELLKSKIRQHFQYVEFITKEETKQGDLVETFELSYKGIKYAELNSAMKIIVSVDLINGVQKLKGKRVPILIDNCESVTRLPELDTQIIAARVLKQPVAKLIVKGENE